MIAATQRLPQTLWNILTWDRDVEMRNHAGISVATDLDIYFCDPAKPGSAAPTRTPIKLWPERVGELLPMEAVAGLQGQQLDEVLAALRRHASSAMGRPPTSA